MALIGLFGRLVVVDLSDILTLLGLFVVLNVVLLAVIAFLFRKKIAWWFKVGRHTVGWAGRLLRDPEIPSGTKALILLGLGYLVLPFDGSPDVVPLLGQLDDLGVLILILHVLLGPDRLAKMRADWSGSDAAFESLRRFAFRGRK